SVPMFFVSKKSYSNTDAWTAYRIGTSYSSTADNDKAITFLQRAVDLAPYQFDFRNKLAQLQYQVALDSEPQTENSKPQTLLDDARKNFQFILNENPKYASAWVSLGYI